MARHANRERLEDIYDAVDEYPGKRPGFIARLLGLHRSDVTRSLPAMEDRDMYLSEDERGCLWPFRREN